MRHQSMHIDLGGSRDVQHSESSCIIEPNFDAIAEAEDDVIVLLTVCRGKLRTRYVSTIDADAARHAKVQDQAFTVAEV